MIMWMAISGVEKEGDKCDIESAASLAVVHAFYQSVQSFFYAHRIDRHYEQNNTNPELALFHLKCRVSNRVSGTDFFGK